MEIIEEFVKELDELLFSYNNILDDRNKSKQLWNSIKQNKTILEIAIKVVNKKHSLGDSVVGRTICDYILNDYECIQNKDIYENLINTIYSNTDVSSTYGNRNISFLITTLLNDDLVLAEEQKIFLVEQAKKRPGTKLTEDGHNINHLHYFGESDIRDLILKNNNFTYEEKKELIPVFYADQNEALEKQKILNDLKSNTKKI